MGDSWIISNKAEYIFLYKRFKELCPYFINMGMTYEQFWEDDPTITKAYFQSYKMKLREETEKEQYYMWKQGMYIYEALCDVAPILHAFSKNGTKPLPYSKAPYGFENKQKEIEENREPTNQEVENERLKAQIFFANWSRATQKQFNDSNKR